MGILRRHRRGLAHPTRGDIAIEKKPHPAIRIIVVASLTILLFLFAFYWTWTVLQRATRPGEE